MVQLYFCSIFALVPYWYELSDVPLFRIVSWKISRPNDLAQRALLWLASGAVVPSWYELSDVPLFRIVSLGPSTISESF